MIDFHFETDFSIPDKHRISTWIENTIKAEGRKTGEISYVFCDDAYLYNLNVEFLNHDTLTDIISFDYSIGKIIQCDIFISVERVAENAQEFNVSFEEELHRVIIHGILHCCGYKDKAESDAKVMRTKENYYLERR